MNEFLQKKLFGLLTEFSNEVTNEEIQQAYESFVTEVETLSQDDKDYTTTYRLLNLTRIEFQSLQIQILYEQGKKCA